MSTLTSVATRAPVAMLFSRLVLFAVFQALIAAILAGRGTPDAWRASAAWWPLSVTLANVVCVALLAWLARAEGKRLRDLYNFGHESRRFGRDLLTLLVAIVLMGPIAMGPNIGTAILLFGDPETATSMFMQPLPFAVAAVTLVSFPLTIAFAELPTYFGYVMPRLEKLWGSRWKALAACALMLGAQHATLPLIFDGRFIVWRLVMFIPFALFVGGLVRWRPSMLPWLMGVHAVIDFPVAWMVFAASR
ncbi:MAG: hypothetical protein WBV82_14820 [Myxococcaceae bacterium]